MGMGGTGCVWLGGRVSSHDPPRAPTISGSGRFEILPDLIEKRTPQYFSYCKALIDKPL